MKKKISNLLLFILLILSLASSVYANPLDNVKTLEQEREYFINLYNELFEKLDQSDQKGKTLQQVADLTQQMCIDKGWSDKTVHVDIFGFRQLKNTFIVRFIFVGKFKDYYKFHMVVTLKNVMLIDSRKNIDV